MIANNSHLVFLKSADHKHNYSFFESARNKRNKKSSCTGRKIVRVDQGSLKINAHVHFDFDFEDSPHILARSTVSGQLIRGRGVR